MAEPLPPEPPQKSTLDRVLSLFTDVRSGRRGDALLFENGVRAL
jgi:hypothetical protein